MHHRIPVALGHFLEGHVAGDAGVIHQHIHRADILGHLRDAGFARLIVTDVTGVGLEAVAHVIHGAQPFVRLGVGRAVRRYHLVAERRQLDADCFTQTAHATRYQCHSLHFALLSFLLERGHRCITPPKTAPLADSRPFHYAFSLT